MSASGKTAGRVRGFSLIEILVVMAVLSIAAVVCLPYVKGSGGAVRVGAEARTLASRLRAARDGALTRRQDTAVTIDVAERTLSGPDREGVYSFHSVDGLRVQTPRGVTGQRSVTIVFFPDGGSSGGEVVLNSGALTRTVRVDWLTGTVSTEPAAD